MSNETTATSTLDEMVTASNEAAEQTEQTEQDMLAHALMTDSTDVTDAAEAGDQQKRAAKFAGVEGALKGDEDTEKPDLSFGGKSRAIQKSMSIDDYDYSKDLNVRDPELYGPRVSAKVSELLLDKAIRSALIGVEFPDGKIKLACGFLRSHALEIIRETQPAIYKTHFAKIPFILHRPNAGVDAEELRCALMYDHGSEAELTEAEVYSQVRKLLAQNKSEPYIAIALSKSFRNLASIGDRAEFDAALETLRTTGSYRKGKSKTVYTSEEAYIKAFWRGRIQRFHRVARAIPEVQEVYMKGLKKKEGGIRFSFNDTTALDTIANGAVDQIRKSRAEEAAKAAAQKVLAEGGTDVGAALAAGRARDNFDLSAAAVDEIRREAQLEWLKERTKKVADGDDTKRSGEGRLSVPRVQTARQLTTSQSIKTIYSALLGDEEAQTALGKVEEDLTRIERAIRADADTFWSIVADIEAAIVEEPADGISEDEDGENAEG